MTPSRLSQPAVPSGLHGVVLDRFRFGTELSVQFHGGVLGPRLARVPTAHVRVTKRRGGVEHFERRSDHRTSVRIGALVALFALPTWTCVHYLLTGGDVGGLAEAVLVGMMSQILGLISLLFTDPARALVYCFVLWVAVGLSRGKW